MRVLDVEPNWPKNKAFSHTEKQFDCMYLLKYGMTWNDLQQARNDLKRPTASKKRTETTWNNLERARNDMIRPTTSKEQSETTCKEQILTSWNPSTWKLINWRAPLSQRSYRSILCLQYFVSSVHMRNDGRQKDQSKCQNQTRQSKKILNNHLIS